MKEKVDKGGVKKMINGLTISEINRLFVSEKQYKEFRKTWIEACVRVNKQSKNRELLEEIKKGEQQKRNGG